MKSFNQFLQEKEMEFYNNPKVVQKVPNTSDPVHGAEDYMYSNSDMQSFYSRGNGFVNDDHADYYEVIKAVKDLTDKHFFLRNMTWKVESSSKKIIFTFIVTKLESDEEVDFFLHGVQQHLSLNIIRKLGDIYDIEAKIDTDEENHKILKLILNRNSKDRKRAELIQVGNKNVELMNPKGASITRM